MSADRGREFLLPAGLDRHVAAMRAHLVAKIAAADGFLPFDAFMHEALYAPGLGYYVAGLTKFGASGDFVTAPDISPLFGRTIARNLVPVLDAIDSRTVVEYGPGAGALADAIIAWFAAADRPLDYRLVEISPDLAARQQQRLARWCDAPGITVTWSADPANEPVRGAIIANEVADALPVRRFQRTADGVVELGIASAGDTLVAAERAADAALGDAVAAIESRRGAPLPAGYVSEYAPALAGWVATLAQSLQEGLLLISDYGAGTRDYYNDERSAGTFRCISRHRAFDDPLLAPGVVDMTAWVDFTALAEAGTGAGLELTGYTTQSGFLLGGGIDQELGAAPSPADAAAVKTLVLPGEMGERFRFLGFNRGTLPAVAGFGFRDIRHSL